MSKHVHVSPQGLLAGMNRFLSLLEITFRRDPNNFRPRINKLNSIKVLLTSTCCPNSLFFFFLPPSNFDIVFLNLQDTEQKKSGNYFFLDD